MKVVIAASAFHPSVGGVEELVRQHALERRRRGLATEIAVNRWPRDLPETADVDGLMVRRYAFRTGGGNVRQNLGAWLLSGGALNKFCHDLQRDKVELIHVQCVSCNAHYSLQAARRLRLPLVVSLQGELTMDASRLFERKDSARQLYRQALENADAITACSAQTLAEAEQFFGRPLGGRARVVYNGVRMEDFNSATPYSWPRPYVLAIGRHVPQKGFDTLLRAWAGVRPNGLDLLLAGDGPERSNLQALAGELQISASVQFLGKVDHAKAVSLFAGCEFFVLPSIHEPMGIVNLEAMAAGKPVIASRVGGVPELVAHEHTGLLAPPGDAEAFAQAISKLIQQTDLRRRLGEAGRIRAAAFSWQAIADQYEQVYQQAIQNRAARAA